jgi:hypothetical protein
VVNTPSNFDIAVTAYRERCSNDAILFQQPVEEYSRQINGVVYFRTSLVGYVARFDIRRHRLLD